VQSQALTTVERTEAISKDIARLRSGWSDFPDDEVWQACPAEVKRIYLKWRTARRNGQILLAVTSIFASAAAFEMALSRVTIFALAEFGYVLNFAIVIVNSIMLFVLTARLLGHRYLEVKLTASADVAIAGPAPAWETDPVLLTALEDKPVDIFGLSVSRGAILIGFILAMFTEILAVLNYVPALLRIISGTQF
jgi:hypothetical protein